MPTFTDPLREIDAASVKEYALQRGAAELSDDFVHEAGSLTPASEKKCHEASKMAYFFVKFYKFISAISYYM